MLSLYTRAQAPLRHDLTLLDQFLRGFPPLMGQATWGARATLRRGPEGEPSRWPRVNLTETGDAFQVEALVPGFRSEDIVLSFEQDALLIEANLESEANSNNNKEDEKATVLCTEHRKLSFKRRLHIGIDIDATNISATMKNGMLVVTLPKLAPAESRAIPISAADG